MATKIAPTLQPPLNSIHPEISYLQLHPEIPHSASVSHSQQQPGEGRKGHMMELFDHRATSRAISKPHDVSSSEDDEADESSDSQDETESNSDAHVRRRPRIHFDVTDLQRLYHLPLKTAAEKLCICEAALKRICRRNRIKKWPYRQLSSVLRRIADLDQSDEVIVETDAHQSAREAYMLPHEIERSRRAHSHTSERSWKRAQRKQLEEERKRIIASAHDAKRSRKKSSKKSRLQMKPNKQRRRMSDPIARPRVVSFPQPRASPLRFVVVTNQFQCPTDDGLLRFLAEICVQDASRHA